MNKKSSILNLDANIVVLIAYLGGLVFRWLHILCYLAWIIPLIIYLCESKNEFVKKQSAQATLLYLVSSLLSVAVYMLLIIFAPSKSQDIYNMIITGSLFLVGVISILATIIAITITIFGIVAIVKTYNYEDYEIPYLSKYLSKFRSYLEILEGKNKQKAEPCHCEECHCTEEQPKEDIKTIKIRPHKIRNRKESNTTSRSRTKVQKIHKEK